MPAGVLQGPLTVANVRQSRPYLPELINIRRSPSVPAKVHVHVHGQVQIQTRSRRRKCTITAGAQIHDHGGRAGEPWRERRYTSTADAQMDHDGGADA